MAKLSPWLAWTSYGLAITPPCSARYYSTTFLGLLPSPLPHRKLALKLENDQGEFLEYTENVIKITETEKSDVKSQKLSADIKESRCDSMPNTWRDLGLISLYCVYVYTGCEPWPHSGGQRGYLGGSEGYLRGSEGGYLWGKQTARTAPIKP